MKTQQLPVSQITNHLDDIDHALHRLSGLVSALTLLAEDFGLAADSGPSNAFWSILSGGESFISQGLASSDALHSCVKHATIC